MRTLTSVQTMVIIIVMTMATVLTRFVPFFLFKDSKSNNSYISYLGKVLPFSAIGLLVVYCLRDVDFIIRPHGIPETISVLAIAIVHYWKENTLLSIGLGTLIYMILVQTVFI